MKTKRIKLEIPTEKVAFFALSCSEPIHKIAWSINSLTQLNLKEHEGINFLDNTFPMQKDEVSIPENNFSIVKNRIEAFTLIKELQNVDYILKIEGNMSKEDQKMLFSVIKSIPSINAIIQLDPSRHKNLNLLLNH
jgi:hypothetical protein